MGTPDSQCGTSDFGWNSYAPKPGGVNQASLSQSSVRTRHGCYTRMLRAGQTELGVPTSQTYKPRTESDRDTPLRAPSQGEADNEHWQKCDSLISIPLCTVHSAPEPSV